MMEIHDKVPKGFTPIGIRLAIREEGGVIRAYLAKADTMEGATPISTIDLKVVTLDGGREGELFQGWFTTLSAWINRVASDISGEDLSHIKSFNLSVKETLQ